MSRARAAFFLGCGLMVGACTAPRDDPREDRAWIESNLVEQAARIEGGPVAIQQIYKDLHLSVNLLRLTGPIALHRHLQSEECAYLISGTGTFESTGGTREMKAGDFAVVPPNTPHAFTPTGTAPAVILSIFTPPFIAGDRVYEQRSSEDRRER